MSNTEAYLVVLLHSWNHIKGEIGLSEWYCACFHALLIRENPVSYYRRTYEVLTSLVFNSAVEMYVHVVQD